MYTPSNSMVGILTSWSHQLREPMAPLILTLLLHSLKRTVASPVFYFLLSSPAVDCVKPVSQQLLCPMWCPLCCERLLFPIIPCHHLLSLGLASAGVRVLVDPWLVGDLVFMEQVRDLAGRCRMGLSMYLPLVLLSPLVPFPPFAPICP